MDVYNIKLWRNRTIKLNHIVYFFKQKAECKEHCVNTTDHHGSAEVAPTTLNPNHRCKKRFLSFFILATFLHFLTFFYFAQRFLFKKRALGIPSKAS